MATKEVAQQFDQISAVYDETRDPLDPDTLDAIAERFPRSGIGRLLEVGVGTGRISRPLLDRGFDMTGVDASVGMLAVARRKGLPRLVRGSAYRLPFRDRTFDATLFVHVLHLLERVPDALNQGVRVSTHGVMALVHPGRPKEEGAEAGRKDPRRLLAEYLEQEGYPARGGTGGPRVRERKLLEQFPPDELVVVADREVTEPLARRLNMLERRGSRHTLDIPPEVLRRAAEAVRAEVGDQTVTYRRVEAIATWSGGPYRQSTTTLDSDSGNG